MYFEEVVEREREAQESKWGEQNHSPAVWMLILSEEMGELSKAFLDHYRKTTSYNLYSLQAEKELVQIGAVVKAMWESCKRNGWRE